MGRAKHRKAKEPKPAAAGLPGDPKVLELTRAQLDAAIDRMEAGTALPEDFRLLRDTTATFTFLTEEMRNKNASIRRLKLLLFGVKTEKTSVVCPPEKHDAQTSAQGKDESSTKPRAPGHGRNGASAFPSADKVKVAHEILKAGDDCPECPCGKLYPKSQPAVMVRIVGMSPLHATVIERETLRCNGCGETFTAKAPEGTSPEKYDETASAMVGLFKYGTGMPFNRLARFQANLGIPLPPATQWDLVLKAAGLLDPAFEELVRWAAQGQVIHNDDTTMKLLDRPDLQTEGKKQRTGVYTTGIVSKVQNHRIALFLTGMQHAGENLADVLKRRAEELAKPIQMCDALAANTKGEFDTLLAHCLAHARRKFVDVTESFPEECRHLLETLRVIYSNDAQTKAMPPPERLKFHQEHSQPLMTELHTWLLGQIEGRKTEPNSGLGQAISYTLKHWQELTLFLRDGRAPLDNNICERALKRAILHRKNSLFYRTLNGARVGDVFMSLIHSAELNKANPFDYLVELQRNHALVDENPEEWMPWNYRQTLDGLTK
jgi:transposase